MHKKYNQGEQSSDIDVTLFISSYKQYKIKLVTSVRFDKGKPNLECNTYVII